MPYSDNGQKCTLKIIIVTKSACQQGMAILEAILRGYLGQNTYKLVQEIDKSNAYMEFESSQMIKN